MPFAALVSFCHGEAVQVDGCALVDPGLTRGTLGCRA